MEPENREQTRLLARSVVRHSLQGLELLLRGIKVDVDVDENLRLPMGSLAEWSSLFQNVLLNAANATIAEATPRIRVFARGGGKSIRIMDNGFGMDLRRSEEFFDPFVRGDQVLPAERRVLGMGGTGLGLTIVRTIAEARGASVGFEKPPQKWSTAFVLKW
jgi:signal transduction histidine kinase